MDDLLLTALSESGLDEFVFETEEQPSTSTQVQTQNEITAVSAMPSTSSYEPPQIRRLDEVIFLIRTYNSLDYKMVKLE